MLNRPNKGQRRYPCTILEKNDCAYCTTPICPGILDFAHIRTVAPPCAQMAAGAGALRLIDAGRANGLPPSGERPRTRRLPLGEVQGRAQGFWHGQQVAAKRALAGTQGWFVRLGAPPRRRAVPTLADRSQSSTPAEGWLLLANGKIVGLGQNVCGGILGSKLGRHLGLELAGARC